jgi:hypothetical protein
MLLPFSTSGIQTFTKVHHETHASFATLETNINNWITTNIDGDADNFYSVDVKYIWDGTNYNASIIYTRYLVDPEFTVAEA